MPCPECQKCGTTGAEKWWRMRLYYQTWEGHKRVAVSKVPGKEILVCTECKESLKAVGRKSGNTILWKVVDPDKQEKTEKFLKELSDLSDRYDLYITGCGCCGSPTLVPEEPKYPSGNLRWTRPTNRYIYDTEL